MANLIQHKRSSTSGVVPTSGNLSYGELGINYADGKLYTKRNDNTIINLAVSSISGTVITPASGYLQTIQFDTNAEPNLLKGQVCWNDTDGTLNVALTDDTDIHVGEHRFYRVRNDTGSILYKGQAIYATGVHANGIINPSLYTANGSVREVRFMGLMLEDLNPNNNGYAIDFGHLNIDTRGNVVSPIAVGDETWVAGDILYIHPTVAGKLTKVEPKHSISVAIVLSAASNGLLFVRPTSYGHIDDNHDVNTSGVTNNQYLRYDSSSDTWLPTSSGIFNALSVSNDDGSSISLIDPDIDIYANEVLKLDGETSILLNSTATSSQVGIATAFPDATLDVAGDIKAEQIDIVSSVSGATLLNIEGTNGNLFSVVDSTSGSLMSVNDITGLPAFEVFSDHSIVAGRFNTNDFVISSGGNVGIGTATPSGKLHVVGDQYNNGNIYLHNTSAATPYTYNQIRTDAFDSLILQGGSNTITLGGQGGNIDMRAFSTNVTIGNSYNAGTTNQFIRFMPANTEAMRITNAGNVGIGTSSPSGKLHVEATGINVMVGPINTWTNGGKLRVYGDDTDNQSQAIKAFVSRASAGLNICLNGTSYTIAGGGSGTNIGMYAYAGNGNKNYAFYGDAGDNYFSGKVGIGITEPAYKLEVNGDFSVRNGSSKGIVVDGANAVYRLGDLDTAEAGTSIEMYAVDDELYLNSSNIYLPSIGAGVDNSVVIYNSDGSLGTDEIDSRVWGTSLVDGAGAASHVAYWSDSNTLSYDNAQLYWDASNNRLGIGTSSPLDKIHVSGTQTTIRLNNSLGYDTQLRMTDSASDWSIGINQGNSAGSGVFSIRSVTAGSHRLVIDTAGNVGIGTSSPQAIVHVSGAVSSTYGHIALNTNSIPTTTHLGIGNNDTRPFLASLNGDLSSSIYGWGFFDRGTDGNFQIRRKGGSTSWTDVLTIGRSNGNVGIGESSPTYKLEVKNGAPFFYPNETGADATAINLGRYSTGYGQFLSIKTHDETTYRTSFVINRFVGRYRFSITDGTLGTEHQAELRPGTAGNIWDIYDFSNNVTSRICGGTDHSYINGGGNFGIGTTTPSQALQVGPTTPTGATPYALLNGLRISGGDTSNTIWNVGRDIAISRDSGGLISLSQTSVRTIGLTVNTTNGNVGLGTTSAGTILSLQRSDATSYAGNHTTITNNGIDIYNNQNSITDAFAGISFRVAGSGYANVGAGSINLVNTGDGDGDLTFVTRNNGTSSEKLRITYDGDVGIGTTSPITKLDIASSVGTTSRLTFTSTYGHFYQDEVLGGYTFAINDSTSVNSVIGRIDMVNENGTTNWYNFTNRQYTGLSFSTVSAGILSEKVRITNDGKVGIGTSSPGSKLDVRGSAVFNEDGGDLDFRVEGDTDANLLFVDASTDRIGIGTSAPGCKLQVIGNIGISTTSGGYRSEIRTDGLNTAASKALYFVNSAGSTLMTMAYGGNIGIGTSTPSTKLHVAGIGNFGEPGSEVYIGYDNLGSDLGITTSSEYIAVQTSDSKFRYGGDGVSVGIVIDSSYNVGIGTESPTYKLQVNGSFGATTKSFRIDHPSRPNYTLEYGSLESPYHGVRLTGRGKIVKGSGVVSLPYYLKDLIHDDETINIQITNIKHGKTIYVDEIDLNNDQFTVRADRCKTLGELEFFWTFTGTRKDVDSLVVEAEK